MTDCVNWLQMRNLKHGRTGEFKKRPSFLYYLFQRVYILPRIKSAQHRTVLIEGIIWVATKIKSLRDTANTETVDRRLNATELNSSEELHWHKDCNAKCTDKGNKSRLRESLDSLSKPFSPLEFIASAVNTLHQNSRDRLQAMHCLDRETPKNQTLGSVRSYSFKNEPADTLGRKVWSRFTCAWQV